MKGERTKAEKGYARYPRDSSSSGRLFPTLTSRILMSTDTVMRQDNRRGLRYLVSECETARYNSARALRGQLGESKGG